jgi:hypothetical protein
MTTSCIVGAFVYSLIERPSNSIDSSVFYAAWCGNESKLDRFNVARMKEVVTWRPLYWPPELNWMATLISRSVDAKDVNVCFDRN